MTGTFSLPGRLGVPFTYTVRCIRDGKIYCTRAVDVRQHGVICFSCLCSFKRGEEEQTFGHQPPEVQQRYESILRGRRPEEQPISPNVDADWWVQHVQDGNIAEREFPGVDVRKVDMMNYNDTEYVKQNPGKYRQLSLYSMKGSPDCSIKSENIHDLKARDRSGEYDNLYACAHFYSSDKNSILLIPRALDNTNFITIASLTFTVIFHQHGEALRMIDWDRTPAHTNTEGLRNKWFIQEAWSPRSGENRGIHESWLWSPDGTLLATTLQDSLLRFPSEGKL